MAEPKAQREQLQALIQTLSTAPEGTDKIDRQLRQWNIERGGEEGQAIRRYSQSLDAALPENIEMVRMLEVEGRIMWEAFHVRRELTGATNIVATYPARAHTEPLARRCAALKALAEGG